MLTDNKSAIVAGDFRTTFTMSKHNTLRVWMLKGDEASKVFTGIGPGPDLRVPIPYVIVRRHGSDAEFVTLFEPSATDSYEVQSITCEGNRITIRGMGFEDRIEAGEKIDYHHSVSR